MHRMPTLNPRITITLTPSVAVVLREMSHLAGNSQSAVVGELLEMCLPVFERVVAALKAAASIQESAKTEIAAGLERAQAKLEQQMGLNLGEMDELLRPLMETAEKVARRGSTPVPVTRGSGGGGQDRKGRPQRPISKYSGGAKGR